MGSSRSDTSGRRTMCALTYPNGGAVPSKSEKVAPVFFARSRAKNLPVLPREERGTFHFSPSRLSVMCRVGTKNRAFSGRTKNMARGHTAWGQAHMWASPHNYVRPLCAIESFFVAIGRQWRIMGR